MADQWAYVETTNGMHVGVLMDPGNSDDVTLSIPTKEGDDYVDLVTLHPNSVTRTLYITRSSGLLIARQILAIFEAQEIIKSTLLDEQHDRFADAGWNLEDDELDLGEDDDDVTVTEDDDAPEEAEAPANGN